MNYIKLTCATLLLGTSFAFCSTGLGQTQEVVQEPQGATQVDMVNPPNYMKDSSRKDHKKMTKAEMIAACTKHIESAEKMVGEIVDAKTKAAAEINVAQIKTALAGYEKFDDADKKHLGMLSNMCDWNMKKIVSMHKEDTKHQAAEKKKAEKSAKKEEKKMQKHEEKKSAEVKGEEKKPEENKDAMKEGEKKPEEIKGEEKKTEAATPEAAAK